MAFDALLFLHFHVSYFPPLLHVCAEFSFSFTEAIHLKSQCAFGWPMTDIYLLRISQIAPLTLKNKDYEIAI